MLDSRETKVKALELAVRSTVPIEGSLMTDHEAHAARVLKRADVYLAWIKDRD